MDLTQQIEAAVQGVRRTTKTSPEIGIILGTGLGALAKEIEAEARIPYADVPGFVRSTVTSHQGELLIGRLSGKSVVAMAGRIHYYEGYTMQEITFPVRVMKALGVKVLIVSNACGGLNPSFALGDVMLIRDHINLMGDNPLRGPNDERLGPRFPDMSRPYDAELMRVAEAAAAKTGVRLQKGVYAAVPGPNLETSSEYRMMRVLGADAVGMSTVPEVIVAVHAGLRVLGFSVVTDMGLPEELEPVSIERIIAVANQSEPKLAALIKEVIRTL